MLTACCVNGVTNLCVSPLRQIVFLVRFYSRQWPVENSKEQIILIKKIF